MADSSARGDCCPCKLRPTVDSPSTPYTAARTSSGPTRRGKLGATALGALQRVRAPTRHAGRGGRHRAGPPSASTRASYEKLRREPVEDFRLDFEDGYGNRPDAEEDGHAASAAVEVATGARRRHAAAVHRHPDQEPRRRAARARAAHARTFLERLLEETGGPLPANFVVTLPKITAATQVARCVAAFATIEAARIVCAPGRCGWS